MCYNLLMIITSEAEMMQLGQSFAEQLNFPAVIELVGDVGAGKTTFTRGLAQGLGMDSRQRRHDVYF